MCVHAVALLTPLPVTAPRAMNRYCAFQPQPHEAVSVIDIAATTPLEFFQCVQPPSPFRALSRSPRLQELRRAAQAVHPDRRAQRFATPCLDV
jgi:hypothetical protein